MPYRDISSPYLAVPHSQCSDTSSIDHLVMREFVSGPPNTTSPSKEMVRSIIHLCHGIMSDMTSFHLIASTSLPMILWRAQEGALPLSSWTSAAGRFNYKGAPGARPSYPRLRRAQEGALSSSWRWAASRFLHSHAHGESKRELCHHHEISQTKPSNIVICLIAMCVIFVYLRVGVSLLSRDSD